MKIHPVILQDDNIKKLKHKKSDDQTNNDKYKVAANITELSYYIKINFSENQHSEIKDDMAIISWRANTICAICGIVY